MNKHRILKIFSFIFIVAVIILIGHFHLDSPTGNHDHCPLCDLLAMGFTGLAPIVLLPVSYAITKLPSVDSITTSFSIHRQISLRAPPM
jgi:hypothetical protein